MNIHAFLTQIIGGAGLGSSASVYDVSIASPCHTIRIQSLASTLHTRHEDKIVRYNPVFANFYPIVIIEFLGRAFFREVLARNFNLNYLLKQPTVLDFE